VTYQWNTALERALGTKQSLTVTYVGANGQRLLRDDSIVPDGSILAQGEGGLMRLGTRGTPTTTCCNCYSYAA
jgi:hypothetical protein